MLSNNESKKLTLKELRIQWALGTLPDRLKLYVLRGRTPRLRTKREDQDIYCKFCGKKINLQEKAIKFTLKAVTKSWVCLDCQYVSLQVLARDHGFDLTTLPKKLHFNEDFPQHKNMYGRQAYTRTLSKGYRTCKLCDHKIRKGDPCFEVPCPAFMFMSHFTICIECQWLSFATLMGELNK